MINRTVIQARLTHDPELRTTQSGVSVCSFRIAWSEKYKENETKLFLQCTAWRGLGEMISKYFVKGQEIAVEGKLATREWTDNDGNKRSQVEMTVDNVSFCGPKQTGSGNAAHTESATPTASDLFGDELAAFEPVDDAELPFD